MNRLEGIEAVRQEIEKFASETPVDEILRPMVEGGSLDIMVLGGCESTKVYRLLRDILKFYSCCYDGNIKLYISEKVKNTDALKRMFRFYGMTDKVVYLGEATPKEQLSYYLGCNFALLPGGMDENAAEILKARYFCLPILQVGKGDADAREQMPEGTLQVSGDGLELAAALWVLKNNYQFRRELGQDSRKVWG